MLTLRTILHPTDFSPRTVDALTYAARLAQEHEAELHLLSVHPALASRPVHETVPLSQGSLPGGLAPRLSTLLEAVCARVPVKFHRAHGLLPAPVILDHLSDRPHDLVILGLRRTSDGRRRLLGSVAKELARRSPTPLLLVPESEASEYGAAPTKRILVYVDVSQPSCGLLRYAFDWAERLGAAVDLVHIVLPEAHPLPAEPPAPVALERNVVVEAHRRLERLYDNVRGFKPAAAFHVLAGYQPSTLARFASAQGCSYIMMAAPGLNTTGYCRPEHLAEHAIAEAPCPVFTIRAGHLALSPN